MIVSVRSDYLDSLWRWVSYVVRGSTSYDQSFSGNDIFLFWLFFEFWKSEKNEKKEENPGSIEFQVLNFTNKIRRLTSHLELHRKDYLSQRGLRKILGKRKRLLSYLSKKNGIRYKKLINQLDIREPQTN